MFFATSLNYEGSSKIRTGRYCFEKSLEVAQVLVEDKLENIFGMHRVLVFVCVRNNKYRMRGVGGLGNHKLRHAGSIKRGMRRLHLIHSCMETV
jgi:hypothetical protein